MVNTYHDKHGGKAGSRQGMAFATPYSRHEGFFGRGYLQVQPNVTQELFTC